MRYCRIRRNQNHAVYSNTISLIQTKRSFRIVNVSVEQGQSGRFFSNQHHEWSVHDEVNLGRDTIDKGCGRCTALRAALVYRQVYFVQHLVDKDRVILRRSKCISTSPSPEWFDTAYARFTTICAVILQTVAPIDIGPFLYDAIWDLLLQEAYTISPKSIRLAEYFTDIGEIWQK